MKKIVFLALLLVCSMLLCSCSADFPYLEYLNSGYRFDSDNQLIGLPDGYILNQGHPYDVVETNVGYDVIVHLIEG